MRLRVAVNSIEKAREQMARNSKMTATPTEYKSEMGQPVIFNFILDFSVSTRDFHAELIDGFNGAIIPSLEDVSRRYKGPLRVGCLLFSKRLIPAWWGFKSLKELGPNPLKKSMIFQKELRDLSALYRAMRSGTLWAAAAMSYMRENGRGEVPRGKVIVFTDGVNNLYPKRETTIAKTLDNLENLVKKNLSKNVVFLNTDKGLTAGQFEKMCELTGFLPNGFLKKSSNDQKDLREQMRNIFRT
jgi:hypothetical protein